MKRRGQFSLEFIITYGWVFLIIVGVMTVIYSTGIFSFADFLPEKCEFLGQIQCVEAQISSVAAGTATAKVKVSNDFGVDLVIYNATLSDSFGNRCAGTANLWVQWPIDSTVEVNISGCSGNEFDSGLRFDGDVQITYYRNSSWCASPPTNCLYTSIGQLVVKIN